MARSLRLSPFIDDDRDRLENTLLDWVRIPSVSSDPRHAADVRASAQLCADLLRDGGMKNVEVLDGNCVYSDWMDAGPGSPTVLVYGHHDVAPPGPIAPWKTPPFAPEIRDDECHGRGAAQDKGPMLSRIEAARGMLRNGRLPVNLKMFIDGEHEIGSPTLFDLLGTQTPLLASDIIIATGTTMLAADVPSTAIASRGHLALDLELRTADRDLHTASYAGAVPNAVHLLARVIADLCDQDGRVLLPGFYHRVATLSQADRDALAELPVDASDFVASIGARTTAGDTGLPIMERIGARPSCDVSGISGGHGPEGRRDVIPGVARATVSFRLVPNQRAEEIEASFRSWVEARLPASAELTTRTITRLPAGSTPSDHPALAALLRSMKRTWRKTPVVTWAGGAGPQAVLSETLAAPVLHFGLALPDDRVHAANERFRMSQFWNGVLAQGELLHEIDRRLGLRGIDLATGA